MSRLIRSRSWGRVPFAYQCEPLERRLLLATVTVSTRDDTNNGDTGTIAALIANPGPDGVISYREALLAANGTAGLDVINFSVSGPINFLSNPPPVTDTTHIIASTNGIPTVEFNGLDAGPAGVGVHIMNTTGCIVRGLAINRFAIDGIQLRNGNGHVIAGNYIGTNLAGTADLGNTLTGVLITSSSGNRIGGVVQEDRNVISGNNRHGVYAFNSPFTLVRGNYIGTSADGNAPLGNGWNGIAFDRSPDCTAGGDDDDDGALDNDVRARNVVSGNGDFGVGAGGSTAVRCKIQGNYIGTNADGTQPVPNSIGVGLSTFESANGTPVSEAIVGGTTPGAGNLISGNRFDGIRFFSAAHHNTIQGNLIGTKADGLNPLPNGTSATTVLAFGVSVDNGANNNVIGGDDDDDGAADGIVRAANVISGNSKGGVEIDATSTANFVSGNYIGLNVVGNDELPTSGPGVLLDATSGNTVGGSHAGAGNTISGNTGNGILIQGGATNNNIFGNRIGTNPAGLTAIGNHENGVRTFNSPGNFVGGPTTSLGFHSGNLISGNLLSGVSLDGSGTTGNGVYGNLIGTTITASSGLGNLGAGVAIDAGASGNFIGGPNQPGGQIRNVISGNITYGVLISGDTSTGNQVLDNRIGTSESGLLPVPNGFSGVAIFNAPSNTIGAGNLISANGEWGVHITGSTASGNKVRSSFIGLKNNMNEAMANASGGVFIEDAPNNEVGGSGVGNTISGHGSGDGVRINGFTAVGNKVQGNILGLNNAGNAPVPNLVGVFISDAGQNQIGGNTATAGTGLGNIISGNNGDGIVLSGSLASQNKVWGNIVGLDVTGQNEFSNVAGITILGAPDNEIGGITTTPGQNLGNIISSNLANGIDIKEAQSTGNKIQGNVIGLARDGTTPRPNRNGIVIDDASNNRIGGVNEGEGNVIAFNGRSPNVEGRGVAILSGTGNAIHRNRIFSNREAAIHLGGAFRAVNDPGDADAGPNNLQNVPFVRSVAKSGSLRVVTFQLFTNPSATPRNFIWEFYSTDVPHRSGYGDGKQFIGSQVVTVAANGFVEVTKVFDTSQPFVSCTVTDPQGNTSEFCMVDSDADSLADAWETQGIDYNMDGTVDLPLPGANPSRKDVYVEIDAMDLVPPEVDALNDVVQAFANAPAELVNNPDDSPGIALHYEISDFVDTEPWNDLDASGWPVGFDLLKNGPDGLGTEGHLGKPSERSSPNWPFIRVARFLSYRYCVFAYSFGTNTNSGVAESNDFMVTLGEWPVAGGTRDQQASVFMHELGHTLGLDHGGKDGQNYKPNYFSVMNYLWSAGPEEGYESSWKLDYSRIELPTINELHIDETNLAGFGGTPGFVVPVGPIFDTGTGTQVKPKFVPQFGPFDLDGGGPTNTSVTRDINFLSDTNGDKTVDILDQSLGEQLHGHNDWANLHLEFNTALAGGAYLDDLSLDEFLRLDSIGNGPGVIQFSNSHYYAPEGGALATVTVVRAGGTDGAVSVQYQTVAGGSASAPGDYTTTTGTLNFADGEYIKTFTIPLVDDTASEGTETISLQLLNPVGAPLGTRTTAQVQVLEPMVARFVDSALAVSEASGTLQVRVALTGETGQTLADDIRVGLKDLLSGTAQADVDYQLPANQYVTIPAGTPAGTPFTLTLQLIDNFVVDPAARTINLSVAGIDSFAAVAGPDMLTVRILDGAVDSGFFTPADYSGNFREVLDPDDLMHHAAGGYVRHDGSFAFFTMGTALYDTTPLDGAATVDLFGGGTTKEVYSMDFRSGSVGVYNSVVGLYARVPSSSTGGYGLTVAVQTLQDTFEIHKNPSVDFSDFSNFSQLAASSANNFAHSGIWYTLVFTVQTNAAGTAVALNGKVFPQGLTGGAPLAEYSAVDSSTPNLSPGQAGFQLHENSGSGIDADNFSADVSLTVSPGENVTLTGSEHLTTLAVNGNLTLSPGGNKVLVTRELAVTGRLDLTDNDLILDYDEPANPAADVEALVAAGFNNGDWFGNGITSSVAQLDSNYAVGVADNATMATPFGGAQGGPLFAGVDVDATTVLVKFTHRVDLDLDGRVTPNDASIFGTNYSLGDAAFWAIGDLDFDGLFTPNDASIFGTFYDTSLPII